MTLIDDRGRLFGRVNVVDAAVAAFVLLLIPLAYGTWLLFRPARVQVASVTQVPISKEERRIANPLRVMAKLKVKGSGFTPMLRAWIGTEPSLGFVFEDPNSADVIVPPMPPGSYDLLLFDGGLEVARVSKAVVFPSTRPRDRVKALGRFIDLDRAAADALTQGASITHPTSGETQIVALGPVQPLRSQLLPTVEIPRSDRFERAAALLLSCDATDDPASCTIGGALPAAGSPLKIQGAAEPLMFLVQELLPPGAATPLTVTVRLTGGAELSLVTVGDRDALLDDRAALVAAVAPASAPSGRAVDARLTLGADEAHDGWRYRGRLVTPGAPLTLTTDRYAVSGTVVSVERR